MAVSIIVSTLYLLAGYCRVLPGLSGFVLASERGQSTRQITLLAREIGTQQWEYGPFNFSGQYEHYCWLLGIMLRSIKIFLFTLL